MLILSQNLMDFDGSIIKLETEMKLKIPFFAFLLMLAFYFLFGTMGECVSDLDVRKEIAATKEILRTINHIYLMLPHGKSLLKQKLISFLLVLR